MALDRDVFEQLIDTIRRFVAERLVPRESEVAETDHMPDDLVREMRKLGLFGLSIPEEYGGLGLTVEEEGVLPGGHHSSLRPSFISGCRVRS